MAHMKQPICSQTNELHMLQVDSVHWSDLQDENKNWITTFYSCKDCGDTISNSFKVRM